MRVQVLTVVISLLRLLIFRKNHEYHTIIPPGEFHTDEGLLDELNLTVLITHRVFQRKVGN